MKKIVVPGIVDPGQTHPTVVTSSPSAFAGLVKFWAAGRTLENYTFIAETHRETHKYNDLEYAEAYKAGSSVARILIS